MKYFCAVSCLLFSVSTVHADFFESRVSAGKRIEQTSEGGQYLQVLGPAYGAAMGARIPLGSTNLENLGRFELVADISQHGEILNVDARPITSVSRCFARELSATKLSSPPVQKDQSTYPIYVEMKVTP